MKKEMADIVNASSEELINTINELTRKLVEIKIKSEFGEVKDTSQIRKIKKQIARYKMTLHQRGISI
ncbi:MAG: 50S ribosomal protein L29 [Spirochaetes bacterium]|jgi:ribosomal protein L29|nr:50S ribosomal protein L29 [Spirochaetota bacterium]NLJ04554.1 50S ribosomal protein L29 [Exilispira sp.]MBP8990832.1 50S ribosomal protein L29 [Spirochaetota bacterium]HNV44770.1 50S ribosomal protein L29 [Exilispira sp.]HOV45593.1 50S ribosomal protein L29 [Exilispira sp.]